MILTTTLFSEFRFSKILSNFIFVYGKRRLVLSLMLGFIFGYISKIYFNPELFLFYGRLASLTISSVSIFVLYLIFKKLKEIKNG